MDKSGKERLLIKQDVYNELIAWCLKDLAKEACGILGAKKSIERTENRQKVIAEGDFLAGQGRAIEKIFPLTNISDSPKLCYHIDPKEQLAVFKELRKQGLELTAIYHSHVDSPAYPSARDIELAFYPESSYIIVSLSNPKAPVARSFRIVEGKIEEEELEIVAGA